MKIVLNTFGSFGDLHPFIAIGLELKARGHSVTLATAETYRPNVESEGLGFSPIRPDIPKFENEPERMAYFLDLRHGPERIVRELFLKEIDATYEDLLQACRGADTVVGHPLAFTARLVAEKLKIRWLSTVLSPMSLFSSHDPSILAPAPQMIHFRFLGPSIYGSTFRFLSRLQTRGWDEPWHRMRAKIGLPKTTENPIFEGQYSPEGNLALFHELLAKPQPDWPKATVLTGFPMYDGPESPLPPELTSFLAARPPPIIFTRGSAAIYDSAGFFETAMLAAEDVRQRALLLVGDNPLNRPSRLSDGMLALVGAPFSKIFPHASVIVHQCGTGTSAQALYAGKPMVLIPHANDQPDNAARLARLGVGRVIPRGQLNRVRLREELMRVQEESSYKLAAERAAGILKNDNGARNAALVIEGRSTI